MTLKGKLDQIPQLGDGKRPLWLNILIVVLIFWVLCVIVVWSGSVTPVANSSAWNEDGQYPSFNLGEGDESLQVEHWEEMNYTISCEEQPEICAILDQPYQQPEPPPYQEPAYSEPQPEPEYQESNWAGSGFGSWQECMDYVNDESICGPQPQPEWQPEPEYVEVVYYQPEPEPYVEYTYSEPEPQPEPEPYQGDTIDWEACDRYWNYGGEWAPGC